MPEDKFAQSDLITPDRLKHDTEEALSSVPRWVLLVKVIDSEVGLDYDVVFIRAGKTVPATYAVYPVGAAILFECTRYGHSATPNSNTNNEDPSGQNYLKFVWAGASQDNAPVARVIVGADPGVAVAMVESRNDLRDENFQLIGAGKPIKASRDVAMKHARRAAIRYFECTDDEEPDLRVVAYLENLTQLFRLHDELHPCS